jgi:hypothetical protein
MSSVNGVNVIIKLRVQSLGSSCRFFWEKSLDHITIKHVAQQSLSGRFVGGSVPSFNSLLDDDRVDKLMTLGSALERRGTEASVIASMVNVERPLGSVSESASGYIVVKTTGTRGGVTEGKRLRDSQLKP